MEDDQLEKALGKRVRDLRIHKRLTQAATADLANVSLGALKHLESGSGATTRTLTRVLRALGQENWLDGLEPGPEAFNPLELLKAREREVSSSGARRVRGHRAASAAPPARRVVERKRGAR
jgi:transcriptional regulator with XRE-family HTH domain